MTSYWLVGSKVNTFAQACNYGLSPCVTDVYARFLHLLTVSVVEKQVTALLVT